MKHRAPEAFWRAYQTLPPEIQSRAGKQFALLKSALAINRALKAPPSFRTEQADFFLAHSLLANASACAERNLSSLFQFLISAFPSACHPDRGGTDLLLSSNSFSRHSFTLSLEGFTLSGAEGPLAINHCLSHRQTQIPKSRPSHRSPRATPFKSVPHPPS